MVAGGLRKAVRPGRGSGFGQAWCSVACWQRYQPALSGLLVAHPLLASQRAVHLLGRHTLLSAHLSPAGPPGLARADASTRQAVSDYVGKLVQSVYEKRVISREQCK